MAKSPSPSPSPSPTPIAATTPSTAPSVEPAQTPDSTYPTTTTTTTTSSSSSSSSSTPTPAHTYTPKQANPRKSVPATLADRLCLAYYRYEVTYGIYTLTPGEKWVAHAFVLVVIALLVWTVFAYALVPSLLLAKMGRALWLLTGRGGSTAVGEIGNGSWGNGWITNWSGCWGDGWRHLVGLIGGAARDGGDAAHAEL